MVVGEGKEKGWMRGLGPFVRRDLRREGNIRLLQRAGLDGIWELRNMQRI
jgi:hypothetical protein